MTAVVPHGAVGVVAADPAKRETAYIESGRSFQHLQGVDMVRSMIGGVVTLAILTTVGGSAAHAQRGGKGGKSETVVAKWDWTVTDENDKFVEKGAWVVKGYAIYTGHGTRVGKYEDVDATHVKLEIFEGRLKGNFDLQKEKASSSEWKGELALPRKGGKYKIVAVFEK